MGATEVRKALSRGFARKERAASSPDPQKRLVALQIAAERMSLAFKAITTFLGILVTVAVIALIWNAARSTGIVIHALSVPPELAQQGFTGEAVANQLLDRVRRLDRGVDSVRAPDSYANGWDGTIAVEIPNTGVTVDELSRHLRNWLGSQTAVRGEIFRVGNSYSLAVRMGDRPGSVVTEPVDSLNKLLDRGAETIFHAGQPYRYGTYLRSKRRYPDAARVFQEIIDGDDLVERGWGHVGLSNQLLLTEGDEAAFKKQSEALSEGVNNPVLLTNMATRERRLGRAQGSADHLQQALKHVDENGLKSIREQSREQVLAVWKLRAATARGDFRRAAEAPPIRRPVGSIDDDNYVLAAARVGMHQPADALAFISRVPMPTSTQREFVWINTGNMIELLVSTAAEEGEWSTVLTILDKFKAKAAGDSRAKQEVARLRHWWALASAHLGRIRDADAIADGLPNHCYPCLIARGRIATLSRKGAEADYWFQAAVSGAPRLPFAQTEWGRSLSARGEPVRAIEQFRRAHQIQPRLADPLKYWADTRANQGDFKGAVALYAGAIERAPRWGALHIDSGLALWRQGQANEARRRWRTAATMNLSQADEARLLRIQKSVAGGSRAQAKARQQSVKSRHQRRAS